MNALKGVSWAVRCSVVVLIGVAAIGASAKKAPAQSNEKNGAQGAVPDSTGAAPIKLGFAIESEMFTYSAMDAEGGAVACNVAQNLGAADAKCVSKGAAGNAPGVVILSGDSDVMNEFQLWRADISTMDILTARANRYCPKASQRGLLSTVMGMFPESEALGIAKALFTTTTVKTPVEGNILDQTMMNDIAGHLRAMGVPVVIPDTYDPHSMVTINEARSPFLAKFLALETARACLDEKTATGAASNTSAGVDQAVTEQDKKSIAGAIDAFLDSLNKPDVSALVKPEEPGGQPAPEAPSLSHLNAVMRADGLAQELGFTPDSNAGDNSPWDVLWLKALESGGDVVASDNLIKGSKVTYTGGSVGTYALFHLNGELECSGVFFNLAPPTLLADIPKVLDGSMPIPAGRLVGGCTAK
jgi:D-alanyl-D-alanine dipeptidase